MRKISNRYYIQIKDFPKCRFVRVSGRRVNIVGFEKYDLFLHHSYVGDINFSISEGKTGHNIIHGDSDKNLTINKALIRLKKHGKGKLNKYIKNHTKQRCLSPRYTNN